MSVLGTTDQGFIVAKHDLHHPHDEPMMVIEAMGHAHD